MTIRTFKDKTPILAAGVYVDACALVQGDVVINTHSSVWPMASIRGDVNPIRIGAYSNIQDNCTLHVTHDSHYHPQGAHLQIGDYVTVGHHVVLHGCTVHDYCLIGMGSIVLDHAIIESGTLLGAGSLVPARQILDGGFLWVGRPARKVRALTPEETAFLRYSALSYVKLKEDYSASE